MKDIKKDIDIYRQKIKKRGFRLTKTRMVILDVMLKSSGELNAEELFFSSHRKYPKIGLATVYRNLGLLEKEGLITRVGFDNNKVKYRIKDSLELNSKEPDYTLIKYKKQRNLDKNSSKLNRKSNLISNISYPSCQPVTSYENTFENYRNVEKINTIQSKLTEWLNDLNKIKREKELALEDVIKDFGRVDKIIGYHENQKSDLIQILLDVQNEYNWLPKHVLLYVSNKLDIPLANIYNITTFYKYFNLEPQGRHSIIVCTGTACHIRGAMNLLQRIVNVLGIKPGDTTNDYNFTLNTVNCLGCCALGPVMMVDNRYFSNPSARELKKILKQFN